MDTRAAVKNYQFAERSKSELLILSRLIPAVVSFPEKEKAGGKRLLILLMDAIRAEVEVAYNSTQANDFRRAAEILSEAISLVESSQFGLASEKIGMAVSEVTTAAQESWEVLSAHGLL
jgi:hypothetical protein